MEMPSTATVLTVTVQVAVTAGSDTVVAVMVTGAEKSRRTLIVPVASTETSLGLELIQVSVLLVASSGPTVAEKE
ncbi:hypothetical protein SDC9_195364 [bioreactor metagenome]|uniref:Uncharacterized protein n=1 Tax=bioreactor metagenome TaxID=1076179 RepID=A0A645I9I3_9ZZZZ